SPTSSRPSGTGRTRRSTASSRPRCGSTPSPTSSPRPRGAGGGGGAGAGGADVEVAIPLNVAYGNPELLQRIGLGPVLAGLSSEPEYANDEMIDDQLRSVLFGVPRPGVTAPSQWLDGRTLPECFSGVTDLAALDIARGRDHGIPTYAALRAAYGLAPPT